MTPKQLTKLSKTVALAGIALLMLPSAQANCYTVYKGDTRVYHAQTPPVDTSLPYSETVPARFGQGASMVVMPGAFDCPSENELRGGESSAGGTASKEAEAAAHAKTLGRLAERHSVGLTEEGSSAGYSSSGQPFNRGPIITGPRGGQYYVNSNGNKTYVSSGGRRGR